MTIQVLPAEDEDMLNIFELFSAAFYGNEPFVDAVYPNHWTPAGAKAGAERFNKTKNSDPTTHFLKAVDDSIGAGAGTIVGFAKWNVYNGKIPEDKPLTGDYWDPETKAKINQLVSTFLQTRNGAIQRTDGKVLSLDICCVAPGHQRKGIGHALVQWGTSKADEMGQECVVESSVFGKGLYEKNGFSFHKNVTCEIPGESKETQQPTQFAWLTRPAKAST